MYPTVLKVKIHCLKLSVDTKKKRITYSLCYVSLQFSQMLILQHFPKILNFNKQPSTQIVWALEEKKKNLNQFCSSGQRGCIHFCSFWTAANRCMTIRTNIYHSEYSPLFTTVSFLNNKSVCLRSNQSSNIAAPGAWKKAPHPDHPGESNRAPSHAGKRLPKHVKMKNGTWNVSFACDMRDLWFYSKGTGNTRHP